MQPRAQLPALGLLDGGRRHLALLSRSLAASARKDSCRLGLCGLGMGVDSVAVAGFGSGGVDSAAVAGFGSGGVDSGTSGRPRTVRIAYKQGSCPVSC